MRDQEILATLRTAERRTPRIKEFLEADSTFIPARPTTQALTRALGYLLIETAHVSGLEQVDKAQEMRARTGGKAIMGGNHHSTGDTSLRRHVYEVNGRKDIPDNTIYMSGFNIAETSALFFPGEDVVMVISPRDIEVAKATKILLQDKAKDLGIDPETAKKVLDNYLQGSRAVNALTSAEIERLITQEKFLFAYLEATRSKDPDGKMMRAHVGSQGLLAKDEDIFLPIYEDGAQRIMPPVKPWFRTFGKEIGRGWIRPGRHVVEMVIGEPLTVRELRERALHVFVNRREGNIADIAQHQIWKLRPDMVAPEHHPLRDKLLAAGV